MNLVRYHKLMVNILLFPLMIFLTEARLLAMDDDDPKVTNVDWKLQGDIIMITYDLSWTADDNVEVNIVLLNEYDKSFKVVPQTVSGDIGEGKFLGTSRRIQWDYLKDIPAGIQGEGYYFEVNADKVGGTPWLYIVAGAAAVGGAVALLSGSKSSSGGGGTPPGNDLPLPPSRPPQ